MTTRKAVILTALALALVAAGCGGGGGSGDGRSIGAAPTNANEGGSGTGGAGVGIGVPGGGGAAGEAAFEAGVYVLTRKYCVQCHAGSGPGFPHIAHPDPETAFRAVVDNQKVQLLNPGRSRLVRRLADDKHFCWSNCDSNAADMQAAIQAWADAVVSTTPPDPNDPNAVTPQGVVTSEGRTFLNATRMDSGRFQGGMIAHWKFEEGTGTIASDSATVGPTMNLTLSGDYAWQSGGGVAFTKGAAMADPNDAVKIYNEIASGSGSQEYSIEAWVIPANTTQGTVDAPARILSYGGGGDKHNVMLGQAMYQYVARNRSKSMKVDANGMPQFATNPDDQDLQANLQHAVLTYDQTHGRRMYVNGVFTDDADATGADLLVNWNPTYNFSIGSETNGSRRWAGVVKSVAIFKAALTDAQIMQNYLAGASQKFTLRFGLDTALGNGSWIQFQVSEFDAYSYLFCAPLLNAQGKSNFSVQTIRIAVNGVAPVASQSFRTLNIPITSGGQTQLSNQCQVVPKDLGADQDTFFVFFDTLGSNSLPIADLGPNPPPAPGPATPFPGIGVRDFAEINDTMSKLTGVTQSNTTVRGTFGDVITQLPVGNDPFSFVSAQQVGIARLSLDYCDQMVETPALRNAMFPGFDFTATADVAFNSQAKRDLIIDPLVDKMFGTGLNDQPAQTDVRPVLNTLFDQLTAGCTAATCPAGTTRNVVKGVCSAVLSSGAMLIN
ncbi:MAG TPA: LamG domain-containing protein [Myxococcota bacterium]|nr:LamG domain-containing protein [Myxococcota bacterium]